MKLYGVDRKELMAIGKIERDGNALVVKGKVFQSMPIVARLTPREARRGLKLLNIKTLFFLLTILFRRGE